MEDPGRRAGRRLLALFGGQVMAWPRTAARGQEPQGAFPGRGRFHAQRGIHPRRGRDRLPAAAGRDPGPRGRVRLRQVHHRPGRGPAAPPHRGGGPAERQGPDPDQGPRADGRAHGHADGVPGPLRLAQPAHDRRRHHRRAPADLQRARHPEPPAQRGGAAGGAAHGARGPVRGSSRTASPTSFPAASGSASASPGPWP